MKKENKQDYETPMMECLHLCRGVDLLIRFSSGVIEDSFYGEDGDELNGLNDSLHDHL